MGGVWSNGEGDCSSCRTTLLPIIPAVQRFADLWLSCPPTRPARVGRCRRTVQPSDARPDRYVDTAPRYIEAIPVPPALLSAVHGAAAHRSSCGSTVACDCGDRRARGAGTQSHPLVQARSSSPYMNEHHNAECCAFATQIAMTQLEAHRIPVRPASRGRRLLENALPTVALRRRRVLAGEWSRSRRPLHGAHVTRLAA